MSLDLLKEIFGHSVSTNKKEVDDREKIHEILNDKFNSNGIENLKSYEEQIENKETLNDKFNSNGIENLKSFKSQHQEEIEEKERIIENLEIETSNLANEVLNLEKEKANILEELNQSKWLENNIASTTKKIYEDKIKTMSYVDSTELIPLLTQVSREKQGFEKLTWDEWLEIPESKYLHQINEHIAKKVFQDTNDLINEALSVNLRRPHLYRSKLIEAGRTSRTRGGDEPAVDTDYILTFAAGGATDYVRTTFNPDNYDGTETGLNNGFTVSFWIKPNNIGGFLQALGRRSEYDGYFNFGIKSASNIHVGIGARATLKTGNTHNDGVETGHGMEVGNWYHWVVTYAGDENVGGDELVHMWINGKEITKFEAAGGDGLENGMGTANWEPGWTNTVNGAENIYFGARTEHQGLPTPYTQGWACSLSEISIYNVEKDEDGTFANQVYNAGWGYDHRKNSNLVGYWRLNEGSGTTVTDLSGNDNHGTLTTNGTEIPTWTKNGSYE